MIRRVTSDRNFVPGKQLSLGYDEKQTDITSTKRNSIKNVMRKKEKDWREFIEFMKKNPETMMSLIDNPVPSVCDAKSSAANVNYLDETIFE